MVIAVHGYCIYSFFQKFRYVYFVVEIMGRIACRGPLDGEFSVDVNLRIVVCGKKEFCVFRNGGKLKSFSKQYVAVFYLLEQTVLNLILGKIYEKYVRFYLGLLLVLLLLQPVLRIFRLTETLDAEALVYETVQEADDLR